MSSAAPTIVFDNAKLMELATCMLWYEPSSVKAALESTFGISAMSCGVTDSPKNWTSASVFTFLQRLQARKKDKFVHHVTQLLSDGGLLSMTDAGFTK